MTDATTQNTQHANQPEFLIQRVYIKDLSFEAPNSPSIFQQEWKPELSFQIQTSTLSFGPETYEVTLKITVTVKMPEKTAFLAEVQQAGIFTLKAFDQEQLGIMLGSVCPSILFPYAREVISDVVNRGTFPPLYLAPVNFDLLYQQHLAEQKAKGGEASTNGIGASSIITESTH